MLRLELIVVQLLSQKLLVESDRCDRMVKCATRIQKCVESMSEETHGTSELS